MANSTIKVLIDVVATNSKTVTDEIKNNVKSIADEGEKASKRRSAAELYRHNRTGEALELERVDSVHRRPGQRRRELRVLGSPLRVKMRVSRLPSSGLLTFQYLGTEGNWKMTEERRITPIIDVAASCEFQAEADWRRDNFVKSLTIDSPLTPDEVERNRQEIARIIQDERDGQYQRAEDALDDRIDKFFEEKGTGND